MIVRLKRKRIEEGDGDGDSSGQPHEHEREAAPPAERILLEIPRKRRFADLSLADDGAGTTAAARAGLAAVRSFSFIGTFPAWDQASVVSHVLQSGRQPQVRRSVRATAPPPSAVSLSAVRMAARGKAARQTATVLARLKCPGGIRVVDIAVSEKEPLPPTPPVPARVPAPAPPATCSSSKPADSSSADLYDVYVDDRGNGEDEVEEEDEEKSGIRSVTRRFRMERFDEDLLKFG
jgi:hypothetical protein